MSNLSERLGKLRNDTGLSQTKAAKQLGIPLGTLASYEIGRREPNTEMLGRLADFYGVTVDYLLGRDDTYTPPLTPGQQLLFRASVNASEEEIEQAIKILEALRK